MANEKNKILDEIVLPEGYKPSESEEYMNPMQLAYFKKKLLDWKKSLLEGSQNTIKTLVEETSDTYSAAGDDIDRANDEALKQLELRARDRERKVIAKIDGCDILLQEEQILDYLRLLDLKEFCKTLTNHDDIIQIQEMIQRIEKRLSLS